MKIIETLALLAALAPCAVSAQDYPTRPLRLISGFPPGGIVDVSARLIAPKLSDVLGQPVIVENRSGSGGNIGTHFVAKSAPDGHVLLMAVPSNAINVSLYKTLPFDTQKELAPVAFLGSSPHALVVSAASPIDSVRELVEHARRRPGKLNFSSLGTGSGTHLAAELLKYYGKFFALHIPYRGAPAALAALLGGDVDYMFDALPVAGPHIRAGKIRLLAVTSRTRSKLFPNAPTMIEFGFPRFETSAWIGVMTTGGTPAPIIARLESEIRKIASAHDVAGAFEKLGIQLHFGTAREFGEFFDAEIKRWSLAVKFSGAEAD